MKTSTLFWLGGAAALTYFLVKRQSATGSSGAAVSGPAQETAVSALAANTPPVVIVNEMPDPADYYVPVGWGPSWGGYRGAWRGGWGGGRGRGGGRRRR